MSFTEQLHPRGTGSQGGQFVVKGSGGKSTKQSTLSYDSKSGHGAGYGAKGGDSNVKSLQGELNRLGVKDADGNALKLDGKLGPRTTASIKRLQKKLGMATDGKVSVAFLSKIKKMDGGTKKKVATPAKKTAFSPKTYPHAGRS